MESGELFATTSLMTEQLLWPAGSWALRGDRVSIHCIDMMSHSGRSRGSLVVGVSDSVSNY